MTGEFWLDDRQWAAIEPLLPKNQPGAHRKDDRRIISGIVHVLKVGCRWQDCPSVYGPPTTIYNRFHRWARRGIWRQLFAALAGGYFEGDGTAATIDNSMDFVVRPPRERPIAWRSAPLFRRPPSDVPWRWCCRSSGYCPDRP